MAPEVIRYEDWKLTWPKLVNLLVLIQGWNRVNVASLGSNSSRLPRGESLQPWLVIGHLYIGVLCRDDLSVLMLAFG